MDESSAVGRALGHVRNAVAAFVATDDGSGESLFLAGDCLELEGLFAEFSVTPEPVDTELEPVDSLRAASRELAEASSPVPPAVRDAVEALLAKASQ